MRYICDNKRHLVCIPYTIDNLHQMAESLNIKRCWFHNSNIAHYDIPKKRVLEIMSKCEVVTPKQLVSMVKESVMMAPTSPGAC